MSYIIKPATESDFPSLIDLFKEFSAFEKLEHLMVNSVGQMIQEKEFFKCLVAKDNQGSIVGYVTFFFAYYTWSGKTLYMDDLYVKEEHRGKGLGRDLINRVINFGKESKCRQMRWQVSNWNKPAISFYESLGAKINMVEQNCDLIL